MGQRSAPINDIPNEAAADANAGSNGNDNEDINRGDDTGIDLGDTSQGDDTGTDTGNISFIDFSTGARTDMDDVFDGSLDRTGEEQSEAKHASEQDAEFVQWQSGKDAEYARKIAEQDADFARRNAEQDADFARRNAEQVDRQRSLDEQAMTTRKQFAMDQIARSKQLDEEARQRRDHLAADADRERRALDTSRADLGISTRIFEEQAKARKSEQSALNSVSRTFRNSRVLSGIAKTSVSLVCGVSMSLYSVRQKTLYHGL